MNHWLRVVGAIALSAAAWIFLVDPALAALTTNPTARAFSPSLLAVVDNDANLVSDARTKIVDVDPARTSTERLNFVLIFGTSETDESSKAPEDDYVTELIDRAATGSADLPTTSSDRPNYGQTVVLLGPLADGLIGCDDPSVAISRGLDFSALTDSEKASVLNYLSGSATEQDEEGNGPPTDGNQYDTPGDVAYDLRYTTLQPRIYVSYAPGFANVQDEEKSRTYIAYFSRFACDFRGDSFWTKENDQLQFGFPQQTLYSSSEAVRTVVQLQRTIQDVSSANSQRISTEGSSSAQPGGIDEVSETKTVWDTSRPQASVPAVTVRYGDVTASRNRELLIFLGGVGISIVIAGAITVLRAAVIDGLPWIIDRIRPRKESQRPQKAKKS